jgi:MFS family permease
VLLPLGLGTALSLMGDATLYAVLPTHTDDAGISLAAVGVILAVNRAVRILLNGPAGMAYDRFPRRRLFIPALLVGALSTAVCGLTRGFWPLLAGRLLWGLAWSGIWVGGNTIILDVTDQRNRGRWVGLYQAWFFVGGSLGFLLGGLTTEWLGYHRSLLIGATVSAAAALPALLWLPETRKVGWAPGVLPPSPPSRDHDTPGSRWEVIAVLSLQGVNRFAIAGVMAATLSLLLQQRLGDELAVAGVTLGVASLSGVLLAARMLLSMAVAPLVGSLSDRPGGRWGLVPWTLLLASVGMALLAFGRPPAIVVGALLGALASGGLQSLVVALTGDLSSQAVRGRSMGLLHVAGDAGSAAGPLVAYALLPHAGLAGVYSLCAALFLLAFAFLWSRRFSQASRHPGLR